MATKYIRYTIKGEHSADAAQSILSDVGQSGLIARIDVGAGETHVYIADIEGGKSAAALRRSKSTGNLKLKEVSEADITRFR